MSEILPAPINTKEKKSPQVDAFLNDLNKTLSPYTEFGFLSNSTNSNLELRLNKGLSTLLITEPYGKKFILNRVTNKENIDYHTLGLSIPINNGDSLYFLYTNGENYSEKKPAQLELKHPSEKITVSLYSNEKKYPIKWEITSEGKIGLKGNNNDNNHKNKQHQNQIRNERNFKVSLVKPNDPRFDSFASFKNSVFILEVSLGGSCTQVILPRSITLPESISDVFSS